MPTNKQRARQEPKVQPPEVERLREKTSELVGDERGARTQWARKFGVKDAQLSRFLNKGADCGVLLLRGIAPYLPDEVAAVMRLSHAERRPLWPNLSRVLDRTDPPSHVRAHLLRVNDAWPIDRSEGDWYDEMRRYEEAIAGEPPHKLA